MKSYPLRDGQGNIVKDDDGKQIDIYPAGTLEMALMHLGTARAEIARAGDNLRNIALCKPEVPQASINMLWFMSGAFLSVGDQIKDIEDMLRANVAVQFQDDGALDK